MAAPHLVPAAQSIPTPPPLIIVSMDSVDDGIIQEEESQTVNDALLPKTPLVVVVPPTIIAVADASNLSANSPNGPVGRRWWDGWLRTDQPEATSDVVTQQNGPPKKNSKKKSKKKSSEVRVVNHQNNYVAVTLSENDPTNPAATTNPCPSPTPSSHEPRRRICWWFLFLLLLVTVACLAFVAVSLVSLLRNGQGNQMFWLLYFHMNKIARKHSYRIDRIRFQNSGHAADILQNKWSLSIGEWSSLTLDDCWWRASAPLSRSFQAMDLPPPLL